jgi:hypothetical protein
VTPIPPDITAPETSIVSGPPAVSADTSASFTFAASEAGSTFECSLDGAAFTPCASPLNLTGLSATLHNLAVRARDLAFNVDPSPANYTWTISIPPPPPVTQSSIADAWIDQNSSNDNKGSDSIILVMSKDGNNMRTLVQFNLPAVPQGFVIASATLRMYAPSHSGGRTLEAWQIGGSWTEMGVSWNNQPPTIGAPATAASAQGWVEWNVTGMVQSMMVSGNYGFLLRDAVEGQDNQQQFHAREKGENIPQLIITFAPAG